MVCIRGNDIVESGRNYLGFRGRGGRVLVELRLHECIYIFHQLSFLAHPCRESLSWHASNDYLFTKGNEWHSLLLVESLTVSPLPATYCLFHVRSLTTWLEKELSDLRPSIINESPISHIPNPIPQTPSTSHPQAEHRTRDMHENPIHDLHHIMALHHHPSTTKS